MRLTVESAAYGYGARPVAEGVTFSVAAGEVFCLLGPNGSGKTSLFKAILGLLPLRGGRIAVDGVPIQRLSRRALAHAIAYVPQASHAPFAFSVRDVALMGRTAHIGLFATPARTDVRIAEEALDVVGIGRLAGTPYTETSGGEQQLALIARALAQRAPILVLDEPTANLDFGHQLRILQEIARLAAQGLTILIATHFPDHAFLCAARAALLHGGTIQAIGLPPDVITPENLKRMYGVDVRVVPLDEAGEGAAAGRVRVCVPLWRPPPPAAG